MIRKTVLLPCAPERAFELFTQEISDWWPPERRHTGDPESRITLSPAGRFFEMGRDGREVELGAIREWEPPRRLVLDWYPGTDPDHPTRVEVSFSIEGSGTRVELHHGPTPASEDVFESRAPRFDVSWGLVLAALEAQASGA